MNTARIQVTQEDARTLAVAYAAFNDAFRPGAAMTPADWNSAYVWGQTLASVQLRTGIILAPDVAGSVALAEINSRVLLHDAR